MTSAEKTSLEKFLEIFPQLKIYHPFFEAHLELMQIRSLEQWQKIYQKFEQKNIHFPKDMRLPQELGRKILYAQALLEKSSPKSPEESQKEEDHSEKKGEKPPQESYVPPSENDAKKDLPQKEEPQTTETKQGSEEQKAKQEKQEITSNDQAETQERKNQQDQPIQEEQPTKTYSPVSEAATQQAPQQTQSIMPETKPTPSLQAEQQAVPIETTRPQKVPVVNTLSVSTDQKAAQLEEAVEKKRKTRQALINDPRYQEIEKTLQHEYKGKYEAIKQEILAAKTKQYQEQYKDPSYAWQMLNNYQYGKERHRALIAEGKLETELDRETRTRFTKRYGKNWYQEYHNVPRPGSMAREIHYLAHTLITSKEIEDRFKELYPIEYQQYFLTETASGKQVLENAIEQAGKDQVDESIISEAPSTQPQLKQSQDVLSDEAEIKEGLKQHQVLNIKLPVNSGMRKDKRYLQIKQALMAKKQDGWEKTHPRQDWAKRVENLEYIKYFTPDPSNPLLPYSPFTKEADEIFRTSYHVDTIAYDVAEKKKIYELSVSDPVYEQYIAICSEAKTKAERYSYAAQFINLFPEKAGAYATTDRELQNVLTYLKVKTPQKTNQQKTRNVKPMPQHPSSNQQISNEIPAHLEEPRLHSQKNQQEQEQQKKSDKQGLLGSSQTLRSGLQLDKEKTRLYPQPPQLFRFPKFPRLLQGGFTQGIDTINSIPHMLSKTRITRQLGARTRGRLAALGGRLAARTAARTAMALIGSLGSPFWIIIGTVLFFLFATILLTGFSPGGGREGSQPVAIDTPSISGLKLEKTGPSQVNVDNDISYTINGSYDGNEDIVVVDKIPQHTEFKTATGNFTCDGNPSSSCNKNSQLVEWKLNDNNPKSFSFSLTVHPIQNDVTVVNIAEPKIAGKVVPIGGDDPPNKNTCDGKYTQVMKKNPLGQNFGDPSCNFTKDDLYTLLKQQDPANADFWRLIVRCESSYIPNEYFRCGGGRCTPDPAGAWGLFQMGSDFPGNRRNGPFDRGDVAWQQQISNAINYYKTELLPKKRSIGDYWECAQ